MEEHPIKKFREEHRLSQGDFAALVGVTGVAVSRWESGARFPRRQQIERIEEATAGRVSRNDLWPMEINP